MVHVYEVQNGIHKQLCKGLIIHKIMIQVSVTLEVKKGKEKMDDWVNEYRVGI